MPCAVPYTCCAVPCCVVLCQDGHGGPGGPSAMMLNVPVGQKRWHPYGPSDQSFDVNPTKRPSGMQGAAGFNLSPMGGYEMSPMMANMPGLGMVSRGRGIRVQGQDFRAWSTGTCQAGSW